MRNRSKEMTRSKRINVAAILTAVLALPAAAFAAVPHNGGHYAQQRGRRYVVNLDVTPDGKAVTNFSAFTDCNPVPLKAALSMKIDRSGAFYASTVRRDVLGHAIKVVVTGKFVTSGRA